MRLRLCVARLGASLVLLAGVASQHRPHHHHHHHGHHHGLLPFYEYDDALELEGGRLEPPPRRRRRRKRRQPGIDAAEHVELAHTTSDDATLRLIERVNEQHRRAAAEHRPAMLMQESSINGPRTTRTTSNATADSLRTHTHIRARLTRNVPPAHRRSPAEPARYDARRSCATSRTANTWARSGSARRRSRSR